MATIDIYKRMRVGKIEKELFGSFIEHMGRAVYGGIYDPSSRFSDEKGFRKDVIALVKGLGVSVIRYPGGNFLSGYDWRDGIGDVAKRKSRLDRAWMQTEPNTIGLHEFYEWAERAGSDVMLGVNLGTGTPQSAADLVEYCNHAGGSALSEERIENGRKEPFAVKYWCLGNEMDGNWQIGTKRADEYGRIAHETAKMMKWTDPFVRLTVCGSSGSTMPTYPEWDRVVLEHTYDDVEYLSLHKYYEYPGHDRSRVTDFLASFVDFDAFIKTGKATLEYVRTFRRSKKKVYISVDEWNIWHTDRGNCETDKWAVGARRLENRYDAIDAVAFSSMMLTLINNADCVKAACLAQLVNVIAPIFVDGEHEALKQTIYYPFLMGTRYAKGWALNPLVDTQTFDSMYGPAPCVYSAAAYDDESGEMTVFLVNNREDAAETVDLHLCGFTDLQAAERFDLSYQDREDINDFDARDRVRMVPGQKAEKKNADTFSVTLAPLSFAVVRFREN